MVFAVAWLEAAGPGDGYYSVALLNGLAHLHPFLYGFDEEEVVLLGAEGELGLLALFVEADGAFYYAG